MQPPVRRAPAHLAAEVPVALEAGEKRGARRISGGVFMVRNTPAARARLDYIWTRGADQRSNVEPIHPIFWGDGGSTDMLIHEW